MKKKPPPIGAIEVLENIRRDIKDLEWEGVAADGIRVLVAKEAVLEIVQDWIEYCLNPNQTVLATSDADQ